LETIRKFHSHVKHTVKFSWSIFSSHVFCPPNEIINVLWGFYGSYRNLIKFVVNQQELFSQTHGKHYTTEDKSIYVMAKCMIQTFYSTFHLFFVFFCLSPMSNTHTVFFFSFFFTLLLLLDLTYTLKCLYMREFSHVIYFDQSQISKQRETWKENSPKDQIPTSLYTIETEKMFLHLFYLDVEIIKNLTVNENQSKLTMFWKNLS